MAKGIAVDAGLRAAGSLVRGFLKEGLAGPFTRADVASRADVKDVSLGIYDKVIKVMQSQGTITVDGDDEKALMRLTDAGRVIAEALTEGEV